MIRTQNTSLFFLLTVTLTISFQVAQSQTHNLNATNKIVSIKDYYAGKIPLNIIKTATQLDIRSPYKFISATVYFSSTIGTGDVTTTSINGNIFDNNFFTYWSRITEATIITFDKIKVLKDGKESTLAKASFVVTPN